MCLRRARYVIRLWRRILLSSMRRWGYVQTHVLFFLCIIFWHEGPVLFLRPILQRVLLNLVFSAVCCAGSERLDLKSLEQSQEGKIKEMTILWFLLFIVVWIVLQAYILPKLGIST